MTTLPALPTPIGGALRSGDRWVAALLLLVMSGTHLLMVPEHLEEAPYAGVLFLVLGGAGIALALLMVLRDSPAVWGAAAVVAALTVLAYVLSRTTGLPELGDDVGNWTEPLSFPALAAELMLVGLAANLGWSRHSTRSVVANSDA